MGLSSKGLEVEDEALITDALFFEEVLEIGQGCWNSLA
jgi:hypothetical protein